MTEPRIDVGANRKAVKYPLGRQVRRVLWGLAVPFFRFSPRPFFGWRSALLRLFGAKVGRHVHVYGSATITMPWNLVIGDWSSIGEHAYVYNLGTVTIGRSATVSQRAHLCAGTHDYTLAALPLLAPPISVGDQAWVCADAFVGPGVTIGEGAIVAARAVAVEDVEPWWIVAGNPARPKKKREMKG